jgi:ABC-type polysaccharide/polyol phosphate export permease
MRRYRFLFEQLVRRELRQKYQGSALGLAWYLVNPLVLMAAYWFMFGRVLPVVSHDDYPLFLMAGLLVWLFFSQSLLGAAGSLLEQGALIRKARFPREVIPAAGVTVQFVTFVAVLALVAVVTVAVRGTFDWPLLLLPPLLVALFAFAAGLALVVSILHAYFRDVAPILAAILLPWFFVSPIFFDPADITSNETYRDVLLWLNPVAPFITAVRDVLYGGVAPGLDVLAYVAVAALVALAAGVALFRRMDTELAVVV